MVDGQLKRTVEWLFNTANERFDIRHAVDKTVPGVMLHTKLTVAERQDFFHDANLILRIFVCKRLGIPPNPDDRPR